MKTKNGIKAVLYRPIDKAFNAGGITYIMPDESARREAFGNESYFEGLSKWCCP